MKIAIFNSANRSSLSSSNQLILSEVLLRGHDVVQVDQRRVMFERTEGGTYVYHENEVLQPDAIIVRVAQNSLEETKVLLNHFSDVFAVDPLRAFDVPDSKLSTHFLFADNTPQPITFICSQIDDVYCVYKKTRWQEYVVKPCHGARGENIYLVSKESDLIEVSKNILSSGDKVVVQEKLEIIEEYRCVVIGKKVVATMRKDKAEGAFQANASQGALFTKIDGDEEVKDLAVKSSQLHSFLFAGVDIAKTPNGYVLIEVNRAPQLVASEAAGGNIAKELIDYIELEVGR